ncbi:hypothetical protein BEN49_12560 [Hymenobacter coccineus]|uniref:Uncharacterized protein n=1 Tax=Hymenobacter coccineus TaxID=1908235 RepID=A0A1G1SXI4_9BACT|nr:hypothetical protein BEN49_12560 [Hymenobacter coccineus]
MQVQGAGPRGLVVLQGVFHQQLHAERSHAAGQGPGRHVVAHLHVVAEPHLLQRHVGAHEGQLFGQRHGGAVAGQQHVAVHVGQAFQVLLGGGVGGLDEGGQRVQGVEQKVRVELLGQGIELGLGLGLGQLVGAAPGGLPLLEGVGALVEQ